MTAIDLLIMLRNRDSYRDHLVTVSWTFLIIAPGRSSPFLTIPKRLGTVKNGEEKSATGWSRDLHGCVT